MEERLCRMPESKLLNQSINQSINATEFNQVKYVYVSFMAPESMGGGGTVGANAPTLFMSCP